MSLTGVWQMSHQIGGSHEATTLVILMSPHEGIFAGKMTRSGKSFQIQGYIRGKAVHWTTGELQYQGKIADARMRFKAGKVRGAGKLLGSFSACRVPSPAGKGGFSGVCGVVLNVELSEIMSDALDRNGLSSEVLRVWRNNEHFVLPQRTSRLATREILRIASQRQMLFRCFLAITD